MKSTNQCKQENRLDKYVRDAMRRDATHNTSLNLEVVPELGLAAERNFGVLEGIDHIVDLTEQIRSEGKTANDEHQHRV